MTSFDALYAYVPREQRDALKAFRENHPLQYLTVLVLNKDKEKSNLNIYFLPILHFNIIVNK